MYPATSWDQEDPYFLDQSYPSSEQHKLPAVSKLKPGVDFNISTYLLFLTLLDNFKNWASKAYQ